MKRVAAELGVSVTTVSKVLNHHADIGDATRERVLAKVELGYRPNAVARSLTLRRTNTLGVVIPDLMHSFFVEIVAGIEAVVSDRGWIAPVLFRRDSEKERAELECCARARWMAWSSHRPTRQATPSCCRICRRSAAGW